MKVRDRILVLTDLLLGALHCDGTIVGEERDAARRLLADLLLCKPDQLPAEVEARIQQFKLIDFDMDKSAEDFLSDPPMRKRRLLELVSKLQDADGEQDLREDQFVRDLARALRMEESEYKDLVLNIEVQEMDKPKRMKRLRDSFQEIRIATTSSPPPLPPDARRK